MGNFGNSVDWWMSTRSPRTIFRKSQEVDTIIRETAGIDPAILGAETGLSQLVVKARQRQLGQRRFASTACGPIHKPAHRTPRKIALSLSVKSKVDETIDALIAGDIGAAIRAFDDFHQAILA
jgi:hypothetical protein